MNPTPAPQHPISIFAGLLSYLLPGLGQMWQGRFSKGLLFMVSLPGLFITGQAMGGWKNVYIPAKEPIDWEQVLGDLPDDPRPDDEQVRRRDERRQRKLAGLRPKRVSQLGEQLYARLHFLGQFWIGVNAWPAIWQYFEMPVPSRRENAFWHDFQKTPSENDLNTFIVNNDKSPDLGWIYTVISGVLNILVIYDAVAGPAYGPGVHRDPKTKVPPEAPA